MLIDRLEQWEYGSDTPAQWNPPRGWHNPVEAAMVDQGVWTEYP